MKYILTILFFISLNASATTYYFSNTGSDAAAGTSTGTAWQTITKFNSYFSSLSAGDSVLFKRGDTWAGITMTPDASGTSGSHIIIGAYGTGANPIITGLTTITGWTNTSGSLWQSNSAVSTLSTLKSVVIGGTNTAMGRYPNQDATDMSPRPIHTVPGNNGWLNYDTHSGHASITDNYLLASPNWTGATVVLKTENWVIDVGAITSHSTHVISYTATAQDGGGYSDGVDGMSYFIENDVRTLDEQNEWYYNPSTKKLTIYSASSPTNVQVATIDNVVNASSSNYITFTDIDFIGSNSDLIVMSYGTTGWSFLNCTLKDAGRDGIQVYNGISCTVSNCIITDINNNGVSFYYDSDNCTFTDNTVSNIGINAGMTDQSNSYSGEGLMCTGAGVTFTGNNLSNIGFNGIRFGGSNVLVNKNFIQNFCVIKQDGSAIYTWGVDGTVTWTNQIIEDNIVINGSDLSNIGVAKEQEEPSVDGIYLDGKSKNVIVRRNSVYHMNGSGIYMNIPINCTIRDNTVYDVRYSQIHVNNSDASTLNYEMYNNICVAKSLGTSPTGSDQRCFYYFSTGADMASNVSADSNYYARPIDNDNPLSVVVYNGTYSGAGEPAIQTKYTLSAWKAAYTGIDQHSNASPATIPSTDSLRFEYNATASPVIISFGTQSYIDMAGNSYSCDYSLPAYSSLVLIKSVTTVCTTGGQPFPVIRQKIKFN